MRAEWKPGGMSAEAGASGASSSTSSLGGDDDRGGQPPPRALMPARVQEGTRSEPSSRRRGQATLQTDIAAQVIVTAAQAIVFITQWRKSEADVWTRIQPGLVFAAFAAGLFFIVRWPRYYWRNRDWLLVVLRVLVLLPPSTRSIGVGTALILEKDPRPGLAGHLIDFLRFTTGTRLLPVFFHGFFMLTSPTSCLLAGIVGTLMTANSPDYCRTRLLSHPLGRRRLALLATLLEFGSLPLVALQPTSRHMQPADALMAGGSSADGWMGVAPGRPMCLATVTFAHFFFGLLLPTFLGVVYWHPPEDAGQAAASRPGAAAGAAAGASGAASGASGAAAAADTAAGTAGSAAAQPPSPRKWARCCGWLARGVRRASAALDCQLYSLLGPKAQPAVRAVACWYVLAQCWLLCRLSAGL